MAMIFEADVYLNELSGPVFQTLVQILNRQDAWRKLIASLPLPIIDERDIEQRRCPATAVLNELDNRFCKVKNLRTLLSRAQLHEAAAVLSEPQCLEVQPAKDDELSFHFGKELRLEVVASGVPFPQFLWFHDNEELWNQRNSVLTISDFGPELEGEYKCLVSQECSDHNHSQFSTPINVRLAPVAPQILTQPKAITVKVGEEVILLCEAASYPSPRYEWMRDNTILVNENNSSLKIPKATVNDNGEYRCCVSNGYDEKLSDAAKVYVYEIPMSVSSESPIVTEKVALLIANAEYANLCDLHTPYNDVKALGDILKKLGFKVMALCDLTQVEMINAVKVFCDLIPEGAYTFFYFAGHGFELHDKYMLPVECPNADKYLRSDSLNERHVIKEVLNKKPHLFLLMLDMCLKLPNREENPAMYEEQVPPISYDAQRNLIQAYATTSNLGAYERMTEKNGIYMKHLLKFLPCDMPIVEILHKVICSVSKEEADAVDLQMPSFTTNVVPDRHYLTVQIKENKETKKLFDELTNLKKTMDVPFEKDVNRYAHLKFSFYRDCFLNAMEIQMCNLHDWKVACEIQSTDLAMYLGTVDGAKILTVRHLQRLKNQKSSLFITLKDSNGQLVDYATLAMDTVIGICDLWFKCSAEEDQNDSSSMLNF